MILKLRKTENNKPNPLFAILKSKKSVVTLSIIAVLLIVLTVLYIFRANILMTVAPREYAAYSLSKTIKQLDKETGTLSKKLPGFEITKETDFTIKNKLVSAKNDIPFSELKVSYNPSDSAMLINAQGVELYGEKVNTNILWDNDIVGIHIPQLTDDRHFAVSSKNFGDQVTGTKLTAVSTALKKKGFNLEGADISFDNIMRESSMDKKEYKKLKKKITDACLDLIQTGEIKSKGSKKIKIDGKNKKTYYITMDFAGEDVKTCLDEIVRIIQTDETSSASLATYADYIKSLVQKSDFQYSATVSLVLKSDRIVSADVKVQKHNIHILTKFDGIKSLIDGFSITAKTGKKSFGITTSGNIIPRKDKVNWNIETVSDGKVTAADICLDFQSEKAQIILDTSKAKDVHLEGTCSNKNGFELALSSKDLKVDLAISEGAQTDNLPGSRYMILEKSVAAIGWELAPMALLNKTARGIIAGFSAQWLNK